MEGKNEVRKVLTDYWVRAWNFILVQIMLQFNIPYEIYVQQTFIQLHQLSPFITFFFT